MNIPHASTPSRHRLVIGSSLGMRYSPHCRAGTDRLMTCFSAPVAQLDRALPSEGRGHKFESCRARHFGTKLGTPKVAVSAARCGDDSAKLDFASPWSSWPTA